MHHNVHKLNKAAIKYMLFLGVEHICGCSVRLFLFRYGIDNWRGYVVIGNGIGIFKMEMELMCN